MPKVSSTRGTKRKLDSVLLPEPPSKSSPVTLLSPSVLLLEIPADANTSLPVWDAVKSQQLAISWTVAPYSIAVRLTPVTSKQGRSTKSSRRGSRSGAAAPSSALQPQMVVQAVSQQHGGSHKASCVLLTFSQNGVQALPSPPGQPQTIPPSPNLSTSLVVSLPLIIVPPQSALQPSTPTKQGLPPAVQTPAVAPRKLRAPSKVSFHTKSSSDTRICDNFLLGLCRAGKKCKMHHTPYPFHWQLRCVTTHRWRDIPPRSQVLLERIYSDVNRDHISMKDGNVNYSLDFKSMVLDDPSKYDRVRRLTNSDSNPYFPSQWKIYWWNNFSWEEYNTSASSLLLKKMSEKEPECYLFNGLQGYKVDFTTMTQTNVTTGFKREVRCRPVYRSPDSMQPYLKTGIQAGPSEPAVDPPAGNFCVDPLEESSSWYPPVWCLASEQDLRLVDVPAGTLAYQSVQNLFCKSLPETMVDIISIQQVQNLLHWDKYQRQKAYMQKHRTKSKEPLERHLFHGTTRQASEDICHNNFDPRMAGVHGTPYGFGSYFATTASFSNKFSTKAASDGVRHMFLAKVLVGKVSLGKDTYRRPPPLFYYFKPHQLHDTCVDNVDKPSMFVVFDSCQCYPYYLIKYKDLPKEIDI